MSQKKVVSIEDRIPKLKQARKKKANRRLVFYLSIFFLLIAIAVYLQSPLSHVRHVSVVGNAYISDKEVQELSGITTKNNYWSIDKEEISEKVSAHPIVDAVKINKKFPATIEIDIKELKRVGYVKEKEKFYPVLESGEKLTSFPLKVTLGDAPLLLGFNKPNYLQDMAKELQKLPESIVDLISEIKWQPTGENPYKILLYMNDGYVVDGSMRSFANKMELYPSIVAQLDPGSKGIIHIGVGAYFESYNDASSSGNLETDQENIDEGEE